MTRSRTFLALLTTALFAATAFSQTLLPGDLNPFFGPVGYVTTSPSTNADRSYAVARQADGKIVSAGMRNNGTSMAVVRYNPDGTLDASFDGDGIFTVFSGSFGNEAKAVAVQSDDKIVVAGTSVSAGNNQYTVVRLNTNGSLDTSFSGDGIFTDTANIAGSANSLVIQNDGKIVTAGSVTVNFFSTDFSIVRLNTDGTYDTSFNGTGRAAISIGTPQSGSEDVANAIAIQSDGKIVAGGYSPYVSTSRDFSLVRVNSDGTLDSTFDGDGRVQTTMSGGSGLVGTINSIAIDPTGRIAAAGIGGDGNVRGFAVARYNSDGTLDTSFSGDGKLVTQLGGWNEGIANAIAAQADGKLVVTGGIPLQIAAARYNSDGSLDSMFGIGGITYLGVGTGTASARSILIEPSGQIVLTGGAYRTAQDEDFLLVKLNSLGIPLSSIGSFGYVTTNPYGDPNRSTTGKSVAIQPDGKIVVGADATVNGTTNFVQIVRYLSDGRLDGGFGDTFNFPGVASLNFSGATTQDLTAIAVQPDGKIVVLFNYENESSDDVGFAVGRLNNDGSRDTTFGGSGNAISVFSVETGGGLGQDLVLQADGKILVAGAAPNIQTQLVETAVYRLNPDGTRDASFGTAGRVVTDVDTGNDAAFAIDVMADGGIIVGGAVDFDEDTDSRMAVVRYTGNGSLDTAFGSNGRAIAQLGPFTDAVADVKFQPDGKIVAAATRCSNAACSAETGILLRYKADGSFDPAFSGDGIADLQIPGSLSNDIVSVALQQDGKIVASGSAIFASTQSDSLVVRFLADGLLDPSFSGDGIVTSDLGGSVQQSNAIAISGTGQLITVGSTSAGVRRDIVVWSYLTGPTSLPSTQTYSLSGKVTTPSGQGLRNAVVALIDASGNRRTATTSSFGIYTFDRVVSGTGYVLSINSKRYRFAPRNLDVLSDRANIDLIGLE